MGIRHRPDASHGVGGAVGQWVLDMRARLNRRVPLRLPLGLPRRRDWPARESLPASAFIEKRHKWGRRPGLRQDVSALPVLPVWPDDHTCAATTPTLRSAQSSSAAIDRSSLDRTCRRTSARVSGPMTSRICLVMNQCHPRCGGALAAAPGIPPSYDTGARGWKCLVIAVDASRLLNGVAAYYEVRDRPGISVTPSGFIDAALIGFLYGFCGITSLVALCSVRRGRTARGVVPRQQCAVVALAIMVARQLAVRFVIPISVQPARRSCRGVRNDHTSAITEGGVRTCVWPERRRPSWVSASIGVLLAVNRGYSA